MAKKKAGVRRVEGGRVQDATPVPAGKGEEPKQGEGTEGRQSPSPQPAEPTEVSSVTVEDSMSDPSRVRKFMLADDGVNEMDTLFSQFRSYMAQHPHNSAVEYRRAEKASVLTLIIDKSKKDHPKGSPTSG